MKISLKIILISSIFLLILGLFIFFIGAGIKNYNCMWAGLVLFLLGAVSLLGFFYYRLYLNNKSKNKDNIRRDN